MEGPQKIQRPQEQVEQEGLENAQQMEAQMSVAKMFNKEMEAKGKIRNVISRGVMHSSER